MRPDYNSSTYDNDIALLRLSVDVEFNSNVIPACLPTEKNQDYKNWEALVSGKKHMGRNKW